MACEVIMKCDGQRSDEIPGVFADYLAAQAAIADSGNADWYEVRDLPEQYDEPQDVEDGIIDALGLLKALCGLEPQPTVPQDFTVHMDTLMARALKKALSVLPNDVFITGTPAGFKTDLVLREAVDTEEGLALYSLYGQLCTALGDQA